MPKDVRLHDVPDDLYWDWKMEKEDGEYDNWIDYFREKTGRK